MASYITTLTSTLTHPVSLCYRMPKDETGRANPVLEVSLPARALNVEIAFPNENYYHEFKMQNEHMFLNGKIIEGTATERQAKSLNAENSKKDVEKSRSKVEKSVEKIMETSEERVTIDVEKDDDAGSTRRRRK